MLVLTRKAKQQIQVGPDITITILQVKGNSVRVGIEAPRNVCVLRTEVAMKIPSCPVSIRNCWGRWKQFPAYVRPRLAL